MSHLRYEVSLSLPAERQTAVSGHVTIRFQLRDISAPLALDFDPKPPGRLLGLEIEGRRVSAQHVNGHIVMPTSALKLGENSVTLSFDAGDGPLNRNDEFLYAILVPARAHEALPCFDQPDLKAVWSLSLDVPNEWEALANGSEVSRDSREGRRTRLTFAATPPIPTYLFAFAAGRFAVEQADRAGRRLRMLHRETDRQKVQRNREAIFDLHGAALEWMEHYTAIRYPFEKFDFLLVPSFQFGGMEHPGAIFYNATSLMLDPSATQNQMLERASLIAHETSHMWFGDLVTMRWFNDVWMKEVFANYLAAKIVNPSFPAVNHDLRFLLAYYPAAYDIDRTAGTNAIRQHLANLTEAGTLYGPIIYQKAPIAMRQLEALVGTEAFREGLSDYLRRHSFGNASWPDLIELLDVRTPEGLASWSRAWIDEAGRPIITTELAVENGRVSRLALTQRDPDSSRGLIWNQTLQVALGYADRVELLPVRLNRRSVEVVAARGRPAPRFVLPNGGGIGYGEFHLDARSLAWLSRQLPAVGDALTRGSAWITLWDAMLNDELKAGVMIDLALGSLPRESDELNVQQILGILRDAFWRYTPAGERPTLALRVERGLRSGLAAARTPSLKAAYFSTLRNVATTPATLTWLTAVWRHEKQIPGLTLAENDDILLAMELAVREVPSWASILEEQVKRIRNPDRKARLQFVIPALAADLSERDRFFQSLRNASNRQHEAWVLESMRYLNHPLRAAPSLSYIRPSLDLLPEIQQTGDIFFPKRWIDAALSGHQSAAAADVVRTFVDNLPRDYPDRLRRIVLSSADELFRASRSERRK
jgi:aminopeptidase N